MVNVYLFKIVPNGIRSDSEIKSKLYKDVVLQDAIDIFVVFFNTLKQHPAFKKLLFRNKSKAFFVS